MDAKSPTPATQEIDYKSYFERKQPANRESTKVLEKFFKLHGEQQPKDEVAAWKRMAEILGDSGPMVVEPQPEPKVEEAQFAEPEVPAQPEVTPAAEPVAAPPVEPPVAEVTPVTVPEPVQPELQPETTPEETNLVPAPEAKEESPLLPDPPPAPAAPEPARTASVQIPLSSLLTLRQNIAAVRQDALVKASRDGIPRSSWETVAIAAVRQYLATIRHSL